MPKDDKKEFFKALRVDSYSSENEIKRAYKKLALQCHPDKNFSEGSTKKQFEELSKAFENLVLEGPNDTLKDSDKIFFDFLGEILFGSDNTSDFLSFFCGSKQHCCTPSDSDLDLRYQDDDDEEDIDGESELDSIMEIIKNRKKKGKSVPEDFLESKLQELKAMLAQHKDEMRKDSSKKQHSAKKGKSQVPVAKPKPKSKKQLLAEQRRRAKEVEQIAMELDEKRKEDEEKDKQRKQMEIERQKRLEEERIKAQNEERKRRERELKEKEKQLRQEQEKEERRRRQQEEEKKRKEEEEKRRKVEKEKADKEKAARKAALQLAKEKDEQAKAANKLQSAKRQPQQQRTDQQQYPREIPPRFQKMKKQQQQQQQQQHIQQSQTSQFHPNTQTVQPANRVQVKPQPPVGKKKDPNRFASKEYAGLVNEIDDNGWPKGQTKGSGWISATEDWEQETEKWGTVDREWGGKEGTWQQVVDSTDRDSWPTVGDKPTGDILLGNSETAISKTVISSTGNLMSSSLPLDTKSRHMEQPCSKDWNTNPNPVSMLDTWDTACDDSIDRALDAVDSKGSVVPVPGGVGWGAMGAGGLGGLIGTPLGWDASASSKGDAPSSSSVKQGWVSESSSAATMDSLSWSKTPGKGPKTKPIEVVTKPVTVTSTSTWGGTPADTSSGWVEKSEHLKNTVKSNVKTSWDPKTTSTIISEPQNTPSKKTNAESSVSSEQPDTSGWDEAVPSWRTTTSAEITGTACWDSAPRKVVESKDLKSSQDKGSGWIENAGESKEGEEQAEGAWDGWTTASSKRNRAPKPAPSTTDCNAWMSRPLKQLLDMGFEQEDADKALRANHMNIESAIGDLLTMAASNAADQSNAGSSGTKPIDADSSDGFQLQPSAAKQNRKQRRKTQQQQQQQQQAKQDKQEVSETTSQSAVGTRPDSTTQDNQVEVTTSEAQNPTKPTPSQQPSDKRKAMLASEQPNPPNQAGSNPKRPNTGLMQPPTAGAPTPLRTPMSHPLLQQQLMQQYHLQLRMVQGGLQQSPVTPQQFALLQQMAQLRMVQQGLAQQQLNQKHSPHSPHSAQTQQQLYQQQQQIALMLAQMQQQILQQQQPTQGRFPSPSFPPGNAPSSQTAQASPGSPQQQPGKPSSNPSDKVNEVPPTTSEGEELPQAKDLPSVTLPLEERGKQASPAPQSRLTQWKQPLLPDPDQPVMCNDTQGNHWTSDPHQISRIPESVSSKWGVDPSFKLSTDPPEFKPGVPWRPRMEGEELSPRDDDRSTAANPGLPLSSSPVSPSKQSSRGPGFNDLPLSNQYPFGLGSSPWQSTGPNDSLLAKPAASPLRPPPGLDSQNALPESLSLEDENCSWVKNLIESAPRTFAHNGPQNDFKFSFPMSGSSWSTHDCDPLIAPDSKPWAAPGGPSNGAPATAVPMTTSVASVIGSVKAKPSAEIAKAPNMGISSWSANQPIPSAEEKLTHGSVTPGNRPIGTDSSTAGSTKPPTGSLSNWLVLRNIPPRADINAIRNVCQQQGPLLNFQYNMRYGNSLVRYGSKDHAVVVRNVLNGMMVQGNQLLAEFATDGDIAGFFQQPVDWGSSPAFPAAHSNYGNHWPFQTAATGQTDASSSAGIPRPLSGSNQVSADDQKPSPVPPTTASSLPSMHWDNAGPTPVPSQLWGTPLGTPSTGFAAQVPSMWSFASRDGHEPAAQSGSNENGLVSPSMTTFLPPGLLNGGESV